MLCTGNVSMPGILLAPTEASWCDVLLRRLYEIRAPWHRHFQRRFVGILRGWEHASGKTATCSAAGFMSTNGRHLERARELPTVLDSFRVVSSGDSHRLNRRRLSRLAPPQDRYGHPTRLGSGDSRDAVTTQCI
jgi:hypothetical protein